MRWIAWSFLDPFRDVGLLIARVGMGLSFMVHGWPKLAGGADTWEKLGGTMKGLGITFFPVFWGFSAAVGELLGGLLLALGLATRPAAAVLAFTMVVAFKMHLDDGDDFGNYSHSMEALFVFVGLMFTGPGRYALDARLRRGS